MLNEGNTLFYTVSVGTFVISFYYGSGSDFLARYGSGSASQKLTVPTVPVPVAVPQRCEQDDADDDDSIFAKRKRKPSKTEPGKKQRGVEKIPQRKAAGSGLEGEPPPAKMHCAAFGGKRGAGELTAAGGGDEELHLKQEPVDPGADTSEVLPVVSWIRIRSDPELFSGSGLGSGINHFASGSGQPGSGMNLKPNFSGTYKV